MRKPDFEWKALGAYMELEMNFDKGSEEKQKEQKPVKWTELTWKDIVELEGIINNVHYDFSAGIGQESFGKEVLERFREYKGDEYLDEAAHNWAMKDSVVYISRKKSFKAGAEWMAGQGETLDSLIWRDEDDKLFIEAFVDENKFNMAENITIQIRKKEEKK